MSNNPNVLSNDLVYALNQIVISPGSLGIGIVKDEGKVRFVITGAGASNVIQVRGRINNQTTWNTLVEFVGNVNELVEVFSYDEVEVLCTVFEAANGYDFKIVASSFDSSNITINTPNGTIDNFNTLTFESSDDTIEIVADPLTGTIDFTTGAAAGVTSVNGRTGDVVLDKSDVNLDQVDNTSDADKPISDLTQDALDGKVSKIGDVMSGNLSISVAPGITDLGWQGITSQSADTNYNSFYTIDGAGVQALDPGVSNLETTIYPDYVAIANNDLVVGTATSIVMQSGQISLQVNTGVATVPTTPTLPEHVTTKEYVDAQDALKEDVANKSIDGTLASNSDTLYPSQKAVKTYADSVASQIQSSLDASTYYHELHVNYDFVGATSDGSPYKPFKTVQAAVNAAQLQNIGGNTAILIHLKNDITMVENITVNNAVSNLYIMPAVRNNTSSAPLKIIGSLTISGSQTNRVRVQDIEFAPTSGYALIINDTPGRHLFQNCGFVNGSVAGQSGTGVNLTSTYRNFIEFVDCTIEGTVNIDGTPVAGTTVTMYRCKLSYANVIVNSANIAVGMYDTYGIYGITHTAGALAITGMWGFAQTGFFNSTASLSGINVLSLANMSLQKPDLSFVAINKTGSCFYQLINTHRGETSDVLTGTRVVYGPTATDSGYKMGVSGNWSPSVSNVAGALDQLAANKISTSQKGVANGVATLDGSGKVPSTQLPSYVDDVLEFANLAAFPVTGETGIIYVALDTNLCYRWSGSIYIEISPAPVTSVNGKTNAVTLNAIDIPFSPTPSILSTDVQAAIEEVEANAIASTAAIFEDTKEPTGFINRTDSTVSFVDGTRIFTIAPTSTSFSFYIKGEKFTKTVAQNLTIPNSPGNHYIYFNTSGVLESTQVFSSDIIEKYAFISIIYWNTDTNTHTYFAEERHGITMDGATHIYLHTTFGSRYLSGLALDGFTIGNGSLDSHAQFSADEGSIRDEDILLTSPVQAQIPILFRQGQLWRKKAADAFPLIYNDGIYYSGVRIPFNEYVAGSWQLTAVDSNKFVLVHFFATNDRETPIVGIQGIAQYNDVPAARNAASTEITALAGLPFAEFVAIGTVIFQTNTYTNTPHARVVSANGGNYVDFRGTQLYTPAGTATTHSLLSGLGNDDHIQYHTDARGDARYYTKSEIDSLIGGISPPGDIDEKSFNISNSQALPDSVHDFIFPNATVRGFSALVTVTIDADSNLFEQFTLSGVQRDSDWSMAIESEGDDSGVVFSITSTGQIQYTSGNYTGFVSGTIKFRAITTSI